MAIQVKLFMPSECSLFGCGSTLTGLISVDAARKLAYFIRLPTDEHRLKVGISWLTKSAIDSVAAVQSSVIKVLSGS